MNFLQRVVSVIKALPTLNSVPSGGGWFNVIRESFAGAWQRNVDVDAPQSLLAFPALYACVTGIANDIAKLGICLVQEMPSGVEEAVEDENNAVVKVLRRPNHYQNWIQFAAQWVISLLLYGNAYILKQRNISGAVERLYILDAQRVTPLVAESGDVLYRLKRDDLSQVAELADGTVVPASEMIHDRLNCLFHPLVGISPIYACSMPATMGNKIVGSSATFFANASRTSGVLTAPGEIKNDTALRLKAYWEENFRGVNTGRVAVLGDGLKFEAMSVPAVDAQLIEQLKWGAEAVAQAFHYPLYKLGGALPSYNNVEALNQTYYTDCLQILVESIESCLDEGLEIPVGFETEMEVENLLRMDSFSRYERHNKAVAGGWLAPNEAREMENYAPVPGGEFPMMQQQNWNLGQLAARKTPVDAGAVAPPPTPASEAAGIEEEFEDAVAVFHRAVQEVAHAAI